MAAASSPPNPEELALEVQRRWARTNSVALVDDGKEVADEQDALFARSLRTDTSRELEAGDGDELRRLTRLRSSTCLAVNVFEPWRDDPNPVAQALGGSADSMVFEAKQSTGLRGRRPNLDVLLTGDGPAIGVECKYLEPYGAETNDFRPAYFETPGLWRGHLDLERLAKRIQSGEERFGRLKAAQLVKHALGLSRNHPGGFRLRLVWYRLEHPLADQLQAEIKRFASLVTSVDFDAITYQELVEALAEHTEPTAGYFDYLRDRYGLGPPNGSGPGPSQ